MTCLLRLAPLSPPPRALVWGGETRHIASTGRCAYRATLRDAVHLTLRSRLRLRLCAIAILVAIGAIALSACGSTSLPSGVVAQVGDAQITQQQLDRYLSQVAANATLNGQRFPTAGTSAYTSAVQQAVQQLIQIQIVHAEAAKCGAPCTVTDAEVTAQIKKLAKRQYGGSVAKFYAYAAKLQFSIPEARAEVQAGLEQQKIQTHVENSATYTPAQAKAYYQANSAQFNLPETRVVSHILVKTKTLAETIRAQVTPANFAALAKKYSIDTGSKNLGGKLGAIQEAQVVAPFGKAAFGLKLGEISQPVSTQFGWHIIYVTKITPPHTVTETQAIPQIITAQTTAKRTAAYQAWVQSTLKYWRGQTTYASSQYGPIPAPTTTTPAAGASSAG